MRLIENAVIDYTKKANTQVEPVKEIHTDFELAEI